VGVRTVICLHQPPYLPWLGVVESFFACQTYVHLDDVQFEDGGFQNRNRIKTAQGASWLTLSVHKVSFQMLGEVRVSGVHKPEKMLRMVELAYRQAPHFDDVMPWLGRFIDCPAETPLMELNIAFLEVLAEKLEAPCRFVRASQLRSPGSDRLANIGAVMEACDASHLYTGSGMLEYTTEAAMRSAGIVPIWHGFHARRFTYKQLFPKLGFVPNLSVVDMLFNCGFAEVNARLAASARAVLAGEGLGQR
jgi:hypothetical protein